MKNLKVSVVMPNINGELLLAKNLPFLLKAKSKVENNILEIIVVDDGSWDGSISLLKSKFPEIKLIKHKVNRGFSAAVNTGARASKGDLILLINTDVIPNEDFLIPVFKHFKDPKTFAVSLHERGYGGARGFFSEGYIQLGMSKESKKPQESFYVSGGSGVFSRKIWTELGGMDEKLLSPFYWEDIDLCFRAWKRGYRNLWEPNGIVTHKHESTISKFPKVYVARVKERNQLLMLWKNIHSKSLMSKHIIGIFLRCLRHPGYIRIILMAFARLGVAMKARTKEIRESKLSDEAVFQKFHE